LTTGGNLVLAFTMLVGRVGPLTLALALATRRKPPKITYAEENVMVG
jgi:trk system potassium uptake protein TrkH